MMALAPKLKKDDTAIEKASEYIEITNDCLMLDKLISVLIKHNNKGTKKYISNDRV